MKISLCAFADEASESLAGQIAALKRNGIRFLELRSINGENVSAISCEKAKEYAKELSDNGISVWSIGSPLGKVDVAVDFVEYEKQIRHICELARIFDCDKVRMFSFFNATEKRETVMKNLQKMVEIASEYAVKLYHENEKGVYGDVRERVEDIMRSVDGLRFVYDPANFVQVGEKSSNFLPLAPQCDYYHVKDALSDGSVVPAGEGEGDLDGLVKAISKDTVLTVEPHLKIFGAYAQIDDTQLKNKHVYASNDEAFDCAVKAIKSLLVKNGYTEGVDFVK